MPTSGLPRFVENILAVGTRKSFIYIADKLYMRSGLLISNFNAHCAALQNRMKFVHDVLLSKHLLRSVRATQHSTDARSKRLSPRPREVTPVCTMPLYVYKLQDIELLYLAITARQT